MLLNFRPDFAQDSLTFAQAVQNFINSESLNRGLPWSFLPFVFAIGVAAIIRRNPLVKSSETKKARVADGTMLGVVLVAGLWITFMIHHGLQTFPSTGGPRLIMVIPSSIVAFVFAFIVGAIVIDMARQVAHSGLEKEPEEVDLNTF